MIELFLKPMVLKLLHSEEIRRDLKEGLLMLRRDQVLVITKFQLFLSLLLLLLSKLKEREEVII